MKPTIRPTDRANEGRTEGESRQTSGSTVPIKTAVNLSPEAYYRLRACCVRETMTQSEVVELLVNRHLSGYVVQVRGERIITGESKDRVECDGEAKRPGPAAA